MPSMILLKKNLEKLSTVLWQVEIMKKKRQFVFIFMRNLWDDVWIMTSH